jgi:hypothetical protein
MLLLILVVENYMYTYQEGHIPDLITNLYKLELVKPIVKNVEPKKLYNWKRIHPTIFPHQSLWTLHGIWHHSIGAKCSLFFAALRKRPLDCIILCFQCMHCIFPYIVFELNGWLSDVLKHQLASRFPNVT